MLRPEFLLLTLGLLVGCRTPPHGETPRPMQSFPADAQITQRAVLTVLGRQIPLNGYLACSATNGQRLIVSEGFGAVLADVLITPDGKNHVLRSSRAFKPKWIEKFVAADVQCIFGPQHPADCPVQMIATNHFRIERRQYTLDLQIVEVKPGRQPAASFAIPAPEQR